MTVAALYVAEGGVYAGREDVDAWTEALSGQAHLAVTEPRCESGSCRCGACAPAACPEGA